MRISDWSSDVCSSDLFEETGGTHPAPDAHRYDNISDAAPLPFYKCMTDHPGTGHSIGMIDRDRAAINVEQLIRDMELITAVQQLGGKGLVQFPQADVVHLQLQSLEESRNRDRGADAHFIGLGSLPCQPDIAAARPGPTPFPRLNSHPPPNQK